LGLFEINEAARMIQNAVHPDAQIIFGTAIDDTLGDMVKVTVIAAGFDGGEPPSYKGSSPYSRQVLEETPIAAQAAHAVAKEGETPVIPVASELAHESSEVSVPEFADAPSDHFATMFGDSDEIEAEAGAQAQEDSEEDGLAVPDFLR
jgi:cell division protein FtsZ